MEGEPFLARLLARFLEGPVKIKKVNGVAYLCRRFEGVWSGPLLYLEQEPVLVYGGGHPAF